MQRQKEHACIPLQQPTNIHNWQTDSQQNIAQHADHTSSLVRLVLLHTGSNMTTTLSCVNPSLARTVSLLPSLGSGIFLTSSGFRCKPNTACSSAAQMACFSLPDLVDHMTSILHCLQRQVNKVRWRAFEEPASWSHRLYLVTSTFTAAALSCSPFAILEK